MYNFLLSERYRLSHQPALYVFMAVCIGVLVAITAIMRMTPFENSLKDYALFISTVMSFGIYIFAAVFTTSFSKDRQMVLQLSTQGHPRSRILLGQYLLSLGVAILFAVILTLAAVVIGFLAFSHTGPQRIEFLRMLFHDVFIALLLLIPLHAMAFSLQYLMQNIAMSVAVFFVLAFFLPVSFSLALDMNPILDWFIEMSPYQQSFSTFMTSAAETPWGKLALAIGLNTVFWLGLGLVKLKQSEL